MMPVWYERGPHNVDILYSLLRTDLCLIILFRSKRHTERAHEPNATPPLSFHII